MKLQTNSSDVAYDAKIREKSTDGKGAITEAKPASKAVAPTVPNLLYIAPAKRGKAAANVERNALFPASADAATGR